MRWTAWSSTAFKVPNAPTVLKIKDFWILNTSPHPLLPPPEPGRTYLLADEAVDPPASAFWYSHATP